ncbi:hypothetical protein LSM04_005694 [Trypanosoma melophagium]|uniref:uncharacterized protein n=1 Tax=Trypanosoma melophagium TaxID=715481 RepID=UPI00351A8CF4|nr:hypothetical protein LSM04_005694 [Trypanosoma melophagium]
MDFDLLDDAEEILQPLCLCFNQDYSRVGVGHHNGYVIYRIHRNNSNNNKNNSIRKPPFYTTVEAVFPPRSITTSTSPVMWEVPVATSEENTVDELQSVEERTKQLTEFSQEITSGALLGFMVNTFHQEQQEIVIEEEEGMENQEKESEEINQVKEEECGSDKKTNKKKVRKLRNEKEEYPCPESEFTGVFSATVFSENSTPTATTHFTEHHKHKELTEEDCPVPAPRESGVGVMALLYKTQFVAVVGGGPYPVGPRNVVKLFVLGGLWADRTVRVPDIVQGLHLDHRLMIVLTTNELRLHSFETGLCVFVLPVRHDMNCTSSSSSVGGGGLSSSLPSMIGASAPFASSVFWPKNHNSNNTNTNTTTTSIGNSNTNRMDINSSVDAGNTSSVNANTTGSPAVAAALHHSVPLAVDYNNKYIVFRSSLRGFSLVRYDTDTSLCSRIKTELLATVPVAHEHAVASLAMYLGNEIVNAGSNRNDDDDNNNNNNKNNKLLSSINSSNIVPGGASQGCRKLLVATSSEHGTLIRIWRYFEKPETLSCSGRNEAKSNLEANRNNHPHPHHDDNDKDDESNPPGHFVKVKEVRNAALPTPIFQTQFLGETFLFCIAWNTIKVFFIGEVDEPKPYDISIKDQSKSMRAQNIHSSLHHLGMVSGYFNSEWAACESPLPLLDEKFLPKWVYAATMELRQHLLRGISCGKKIQDLSRETSEVEAVNPNASLQQGRTPQETPQNVLLPSTSALLLSSSSSSNTISSNSNTNNNHNTNTTNTSSQYWGGFVRQYFSLQVAPVVESATRVARRYWGGSETELHTSVTDLSSSAGEKKSGAVRERKNCGWSDQRDYSTMTEVAQALVVWWERPAYRHVDYMTSVAARNRDGASDALLAPMGIAETMTLYCVTCDGCAVSFEFDPMKGSITCSEALPVVTAEK